MAFVIVSLFIVNLRRSTTGLALNAARWSEAGARTSGISVVQMKVLAGAMAAFIAGVGGGLLAVAQSTVVPSEFATFAGIVWFAALVTIGIRSTAAALVAGLAFVMLPAIVQAYLPTWTANLLPVIFGLGAISAAKFPDGILAEQSRRLRRLLQRAAPDSVADHQVVEVVDAGGGRGRGGRTRSRGCESSLVTVTATNAGSGGATGRDALALAAGDISVHFGGLTALDGRVPRGRTGKHRRTGRAERGRQVDAPRRPVRPPPSRLGEGLAAGRRRDRRFRPVAGIPRSGPDLPAARAVHGPYGP